MSPLGRWLSQELAGIKEGFFLVLDIIDDDHVTIVDGDLRKLDNPKKRRLNI